MKVRMTVGSLIEQLSQYDRNLEVEIETYAYMSEDSNYRCVPTDVSGLKNEEGKQWVIISCIVANTVPDADPS
jgi:hypothetical protein